jgi:DNA-binding transcriptional LysR family regulator
MAALDRGEVDFVMAYASLDRALKADQNSIRVGSDLMMPVCKPDASGQPLFAFDDDAYRAPFLQFGEAAPIGDLLRPLFARHRLHDRLRTVYENAMAGALRMKARAGEGVAWLPRTLVQPDLEAGHLIVTGPADWIVEVDIRLYRNPRATNAITRSLWMLLEARQQIPLV